jgi:hypothetical protein
MKAKATTSRARVRVPLTAAESAELRALEAAIRGATVARDGRIMAIARAHGIETDDPKAPHYHLDMTATSLAFRRQ